MTRNVAITLKDLTRFPELLAEALKLGVNSTSGPEYRTTALRTTRDRARLDAVRAAREKAAAMAAELGMKLGKPITISEEAPVRPWERYGMPMQNSSVSVGSLSDAGSSTFAPGMISVSARVSVQFELE